MTAIQKDDEFYDGPPLVQRTYWKAGTLVEQDGYNQSRKETREQVPPADANLVSSLLRDGRHAPALDIDFPCTLIPSSTPGHFHLLIDKPMPWRQYKRLLKALAEAGIIEDGYYKASIRRCGSDLRYRCGKLFKPGGKK